MSEKGKKNKKKTGLGLAIWILLFLIILIVFLVKQEEIKENFDKSGATALIEKKIGKDIFEKSDTSKNEESKETIIDLTKKFKKKESSAKVEPKKEENRQVMVEKSESKKISEPAKKYEEREFVQPNIIEEKKTEVTLKSDEKIKQKIEEKSPTQKVEEKSSNAKNLNQNQGNGKNSQNIVQQAEPKPVERSSQKVQENVTKIQTEVKNTVPAPVPDTMKVKICFVAIDSEGPVVRKQVTRTVHKDSPMAEAFKLLLSGPSASETQTGCRSLIPSGTRLLSASVKNGIAVLNFSEEFQFNQFGAEGSLAQLMQVVYTATEFGTVKGVQILIEGQKRDYLTEGVWIGSPLGRNAF